MNIKLYRLFLVLYVFFMFPLSTGLYSANMEGVTTMGDRYYISIERVVRLKCSPDYDTEVVMINVEDNCQTNHFIGSVKLSMKGYGEDIKWSVRFNGKDYNSDYQVVQPNFCYSAMKGTEFRRSDFPLEYVTHEGLHYLVSRISGDGRHELKLKVTVKGSVPIPKSWRD